MGLEAIHEGRGVLLCPSSLLGPTTFFLARKCLSENRLDALERATSDSQKHLGQDVQIIVDRLDVRAVDLGEETVGKPKELAIVLLVQRNGTNVDGPRNVIVFELGR